MEFNSEHCWDGAGRQGDLMQAAPKRGTAQHRNICFTEKMCQRGVQVLFLSSVIIPFPWAQFRLYENDFTPAPSLGTQADEEEPFPSLCFCTLSPFRRTNSTCILSHPTDWATAVQGGWCLAFSYQARKMGPSVRLVHHNYWACLARKLHQAADWQLSW